MPHKIAKAYLDPIKTIVMELFVKRVNGEKDLLEIYGRLLNPLGDNHTKWSNTLKQGPCEKLQQN